ncbi:MAG TPA: hypothetical protein VFZ66_27490 [Herpetosiphonaceae bacterium]
MTHLITKPDLSTFDGLQRALAHVAQASSANDGGWLADASVADGILTVCLKRTDDAFNVRVFAGADSPDSYALLQEATEGYPWGPHTPLDAALFEIFEAVLEDESPTAIAEYVGPFLTSARGLARDARDGVVVAVMQETRQVVIGAWHGDTELVEHLRLSLADLLRLGGFTLDDYRAALEEPTQ